MREVIEIMTFSGPIYHDGPCDHAEAIPVESVSGEVVAQLCACCDRQLPAGWRPPPGLSTAQVARGLLRMGLAAQPGPKP